MRILHIISQKPGETGSGMYVRNIIKEFNKQGYEQALICGVESSEEVDISNVIKYPVYFSSERLPFNVVGMSDIMPYKSSKYKELSNEETENFIESFKETILKVNEEFKPDIILCNHLYLVTAVARSVIKDKKIYGICHGTDLRQLKSHDLRNDFIIKNIRELDGVFALHKNCEEEIIKFFNIEPRKIHVIGIGYDDSIFYNMKDKKKENIELVYTGKISYAKGLEPLYYSFNKLSKEYSNITLNIVGMGNGEEALKLEKLYSQSLGKVNFLGKLSQRELNELYSKCDVFVLPSFYEGLPLVLVEALSTGLSVVTSDLNGVKEFMGENINSSGKIKYVPMPKMKEIDVPFRDEMPTYINNLYTSLKDTILEISKQKFKTVDTSHLTWRGLSNKILKYIK